MFLRFTHFFNRFNCERIFFPYNLFNMMRFLRRKAMMIAAHLSYLSDRRLYAFNMLLQLTY